MIISAAGTALDTRSRSLVLRADAGNLALDLQDIVEDPSKAIFFIFAILYYGPKNYHETIERLANHDTSACWYG